MADNVPDWAATPSAPTAEVPDWAKPAGPQPTPKGDMSGGNKPDLSGGQNQFTSGLKSGAKNVAALTDMALGLPGQALQVGADIGGRLNAIFHGGTRKQAEEAGKTTAGMVPEVLTNPLQKLMKVFGHEEGYSDSDVTKVMDKAMGLLAKGGDWVEARTKGALTRGDVESLANATLMAVGGRGAAAGLQPKLDAMGRVSTPLPKGSPGGGDAGGVMSKYDSAPPQEPGPGGKLPDDATINAQNLAHRLMQEGASTAKVEAVIKKNPAVGAEMEKLRQQREYYSSRFGVKVGGDIIRPDGTFAKDAAAQLRKEELPASPKEQAAREAAQGVRRDSMGMPVESAPDWGNKKQGKQSGSAQTEALATTALVGGGALLAAHLANQDQLEAALAGGLAGAAFTRLPKYIDYIHSDWKAGLRDTATVAGVVGLTTALDREHPIEGTLFGMLWGSTKMLPKAVIPKVGQMTIDDLVNLRNGGIAAREREVGNLAWAFRETVKDPARREAISLAVESGNMGGLAPNELHVARTFQNFTSSLGAEAKDVGVLKDLLDNYVTHIVEREGLPQSKIGEIMSAMFGDSRGGGGASPTSPFAKGRKYATFGELQTALKDSGLKVKTLDIADITEIYGRSMGKAVENKRLITALEGAKEAAPGGKPYIMDAGKAPEGFIAINSPQMRGKMVHPDLAKPLQFVMEAKTHNDLVNGATMLALAQKRLAVGLSLFHASNLGNAYAGASGFKTFQGKAAIDAALKAYRTGGTGDSVDLLIRNGLRVERPMELDQSALAKVGTMLDGGMEKLTGLKMGVAEKSLGAIEKVQKETFDKLTWDYLHTGMKLAVGIREFERLRLENPTMKPEEVARQVASYTNDTFGGLDWYRVATESQSQLGRRVGLAALSPKGRVALQIAMFAPDWTLSTFRAMYKALPGATEMPLTKRLHQGYVARTALIYMTLMNGLNYAMSGHYIWENKDPTKIDRGDGTTQQIAKHAMEGPEMLLHPRQTILNKLGALVKTPVEVMVNKEYLSAESKAPPITSRAAHIGKMVTPIAVSGAMSSNLTPEEAAKRALLGAAGFPIYGMTKEERELAKQKRKAEKAAAK